jgi:hypothetical protein
MIGGIEVRKKFSNKNTTFESSLKLRWLVSSILLMASLSFIAEVTVAQRTARPVKKTARKVIAPQSKKDLETPYQEINGTPEEKIRAFLKHYQKIQSNTLDLVRKFLTAEVTDASWVYLNSETDQPDKLEFIDEQTAIARFSNSDSGGDRDVYVYLTDQSGWKISAFRFTDRKSYVSQIRYLYSAPVTDENQKDLDYEMKHALLGLSLDADLRKWFVENRTGLNGLVKLSNDLPFERILVPVVNRKNLKGAVELLFQLGLDSIERFENGNIEILVGESNGDAIGFLYSPSKSVPKLNVNKYFWVESLADDWFIIRRTI